MTQPGRTIHDWASEIRNNAIEGYGEKKFAKLTLHFVSLIAAGNTEDKLQAVIKLLAVSHDAQLLALAVVWMDGAGYGETPANTLLVEIDKIHREQEAEH